MRVPVEWTDCYTTQTRTKGDRHVGILIEIIPDTQEGQAWCVVIEQPGGAFHVLGLPDVTAREGFAWTLCHE